MKHELDYICGHNNLFVKILVIRFSSIGDIVLTSPVTRCLKKKYPESELHFLIRDSFSDILKYNPYISKIITFKDDLRAVIELLKKENYDLVIDLQGSIRSLRVKSSLGKPSHTISKRNIQKWLMVNLQVDVMPKEHIVDRYMKTVRKLGVEYDDQGLDFFITASDKVEMETLPAPWSSNYIGFVIGAKHATKRLPVSKIISIINLMKLPVILMGGKEDVARGEEIAIASNGYAFNACGKYNLLQSASLVKQAKAIITHDTGLMHVSAALHQRIVSVWGNTIPGFGMYPFLPPGKGASVIVENNGLTCRPCSKIGYEKCPRSHFNCMVELDEAKIAGQLNKWWQEEGKA